MIINKSDQIIQLLHNFFSAKINQYKIDLTQQECNNNNNNGNDESQNCNRIINIQNSLNYLTTQHPKDSSHQYIRDTISDITLNSTDNKANINSFLNDDELGEKALLAIFYICLRMTRDQSKQETLLNNLKNIVQTFKTEQNEKSESNNSLNQQSQCSISTLLFKCVISYSIDENELANQFLREIYSYYSQDETNRSKNGKTKNDDLLENIFSICNTIEVMLKSETDQMDSAQDIAFHHMQQHPDSCGWTHFTLCQCLKAKKDYLGVVRECTSLLESEYDFFLRLAVLQQRASVLIPLQRPEAALADTETLIGEDAYHPVAREIRGMAYSQLGQFPEAVENFQIAFESRKTFGCAYGCGVALQRMGRSEEAIQMLSLALQAQPDHIMALVERAKALVASRNLSGAKEDLEKALEIDPDHPVALITQMDVVTFSGDAEGEAPRILQRSIECGILERHALEDYFDDVVLNVEMFGTSGTPNTKPLVTALLSSVARLDDLDSSKMDMVRQCVATCIGGGARAQGMLKKYHLS